MKKVKVAIFHCGFVYSGGGERIVLEEAKYLRKKGYIVSIFAPTLDRKRCYPQEIKDLKVKTFLPQLPFFIPARYAIQMIISSLFAPFLALRFRSIDIFIGANQPGAWIAFCIAKVLSKPYIVYMNQPNRLLYPRPIDRQTKWQNLRGYNKIRRFIRHFRPIASYLDRISFTESKAMLLNGRYIGEIIEKIYRKKGIMCPAGTRIISKKNLLTGKEFFSGSLELKNISEQKFKIQKPFILLTNRHVPQKKFQYGIEAMKEVVKKFPKAQLVIPGPFTLHTSELIYITKKLHLEKNIIFLGQIEEKELQKLYQNASVYVYTSPDEDFGMGVIEAMGAGVPVIAWNYAGPKVTVVDSLTGFLAKPYSVEDFAKNMIKILSDKKLHSNLSKNAWKHASDNFSWENHGEIMEKEIRKLL